MNQTSVMPGLPLLIVVESESQVSFLKAMSTILGREHFELPDLGQLTALCQAVFLPTGGANINEWVSRIDTLNLRAFYLLDRGLEPETTERRQIAEAVHQRPGCHAVVTKKRTLENYLHPLAILEATIIDLEVHDDSDMPNVLALAMMARSRESSWHRLPCQRQKQLHDKAKRALNVKAAQRMTPALLAERDPDGEVIGWLRTIRRMIEMT